MNRIAFTLLFVLLTINSFSQVVKKDTIAKVKYINDDDFLFDEPVLLEEVVVYKDKMDAEALKQFMILQNRVYKVYPYAKIASERLNILMNNMEKLKTPKEKRKYFKIVEDYMENEFTEQLKKLSRKQGQILVKLVHRQTGSSTFDLIKEHKSGWKAFWSNNTAKFFDIDLKINYDPQRVNEDYLIETILYRAFNSGRLVYQKPFSLYDIDELNELWSQKANIVK